MAVVIGYRQKRTAELVHRGAMGGASVQPAYHLFRHPRPARPRPGSQPQTFLGGHAPGCGGISNLPTRESSAQYDLLAPRVAAIRGDTSVGSISVPDAHPDGIHVGPGIEHISGLTHLDRKAGDPGFRFIPVVLRNQDSTDTVELRHTGELRDFVDQTVLAGNATEGAKNRLAVTVYRLAAIAKGEAAPLDDAGDTITDPALVLAAREAAVTELDRIDADLEGAVLEEVAALAAIPLPTDPARVRQIMLGDVEAAAAERSAWILDAVAEQGAALVPGCQPQTDALAAITTAKQAAANRLRRAETVEEMQAARDEGVATIRAVDVVGSPGWTSRDKVELAFEIAPDLTVRLAVCAWPVPRHRARGAQSTGGGGCGLWRGVDRRPRRPGRGLVDHQRAHIGEHGGSRPGTDRMGRGRHPAGRDPDTADRQEHLRPE